MSYNSFFEQRIFQLDVNLRHLTELQLTTILPILEQLVNFASMTNNFTKQHQELFQSIEDDNH